MRIASFQELASQLGHAGGGTAHVWRAEGLRAWQARAGSCLLVRDANHDRNHLRAILTDPDRDGMVLTVGFSTIRDERHDGTCRLLPGDHPFVRVPSFCCYGHARMTAAAVLTRQVETGQALDRDPLSPELLRRLCDGLVRSRFTPDGLRRRFGGR